MYKTTTGFTSVHQHHLRKIPEVIVQVFRPEIILLSLSLQRHQTRLMNTQMLSRYPRCFGQVILCCVDVFNTNVRNQQGIITVFKTGVWCLSRKQCNSSSYTSVKTLRSSWTTTMLIVRTCCASSLTACRSVMDSVQGKPLRHHEEETIHLQRAHSALSFRNHENKCAL